MPGSGVRLLLLADTWERWWRADVGPEPGRRVGGARLRVLPADCMFRIVAVPPGAARVTFRYEPLPVKLGVLLCGLTAGLLAAAAAAAWRG